MVGIFSHQSLFRAVCAVRISGEPADRDSYRSDTPVLFEQERSRAADQGEVTLTQLDFAKPLAFTGNACSK